MLRIYEKDLTADGLQAALATNGLGRLTHTQSATEHRVINGDWSLRLTYPLDAPGADLLQPERLICYEDEAGNARLYRISRRKPRTTRQGRVIDIEAPHVAYDLCHKYIVNIETKEDDRYLDGIDARTALTQLLEGTGFRVGEVTVDLTELNYLDILQKDVMTCLKEQLLKNWGGELQFDNFTIHLKAALGTDRRYPIRDGRNIEQITVTENYEPVVTRLHVRGYDNANFEEINGGRDWIDSELLGRYSHVREGYVDFDDVDDPQELMRLGREELAKREVPEITYDIRLAQMRGSVQYAAYRRLEYFDLGDTAVLHTDVLDRDVILRCSEMETDCLTGRNTSVTLGNTDKELLGSITAGASAADRLARVLDNNGYLQAEKIEGKLDLVRITNLKADIAEIAKAVISEATITTAQIDQLAARVVEIVEASIGTMKVNWADIVSLTTAVAEIVKAEVGTADIDWAHIKDTVTDTAIITQGEAGELYIARLAVTEANMVSLSVGELLVKGQDGGFWAVTVDDAGQVTTEKKTEVGDDIADVTIDAGQKVIDGTITADKLNARSIFADSALIRELMAANIDVDTLFAREATINAINAMDIRGNEYLKLYVEDKAKALRSELTVTDDRIVSTVRTSTAYKQDREKIYADMDEKIGYRLEIVSTSDILSTEVKQARLMARVWHGKDNVTADIDAARFVWHRQTADSVADGIWDEQHKGMKEVTVTVTDVWYSATYTCELADQ